MLHIRRGLKQSMFGRWLGILGLVALFGLLGVADAGADICGCAGDSETLGAFDSGDPTTYPPGTTVSNPQSLTTGYGRWILIPLPPDGIMKFTSFRVRTRENGWQLEVWFSRNSANTPVTLLVSGDVTINGDGRIMLNGSSGEDGRSDRPVIGGLGGPGGFRGGDGAYQYANFADTGGSGFGPGGGTGGTPLVGSLGGSFVGAPELLPPIGGSGGGGGNSTKGDLGCSGGGGGGGGGAILIAANGTITVNGIIASDGGQGGLGQGTCGGVGSGGSGGAIRLVANTIAGTGNTFARGGWGRDNNRPEKNGSPGKIRLEAFSNTFSATNSSPVATRSVVGPLTLPLNPAVAITAVAGKQVPVPPQGGIGGTDVTVEVPGTVPIDLMTTGVPGGTTIAVTVKPRIGGAPITTNVTINPASCTLAGNCSAAVAFDLPAGMYVVEARATFQTP